MSYTVKSRYRKFYEGDDPQEALRVYQTLKSGGQTGAKMSPDLSAKSFLTDFVHAKNKIIFSSDYGAFLVNEYLGRYKTPVEVFGRTVYVLNENFLEKIVYLTQELFKKPAELTSIAKNKLGITGDIKKYEVSLQDGQRKQIFAYSNAEARAYAEEMSNNKVTNVKEIKK
jgi:hypothetical protein